MSANILDSHQVEKFYRAGDIVMAQGELGHCAWYIHSGRVEIRVQTASGELLQVGTRGAGSIIGEMAILDDLPRSATVVALEDSTMLEISKEDFTRSVRSAPPIVRLITQVILARYRDVLGRSEMLTSNGETKHLENQERAYAEQSNVVEAIRMANEFKVAISQRQLRLHYQPMIDLESGELIGFEALLRWQHPVRGLIPPDVFIPMAEDSGLIVEASRWVLQEACEALARIDRVTGGGQFMSVNFSAPDFEQGNFTSWFESVLTEASTDPDRIHVEIIERVLIRQLGDARNALQRFRDIGVGVAIDDFGTGYSSLSYLHQYPINMLKIDQSFIRQMCEDEMSMRLVKSVLSLSQNLGMKTIAEGVETARQDEVLRELGCDIAQGFYYARPMDESALMEYLASRQ
jgi:EAL domain-containing protein (putative c-di-GMP-specific phosphodiesterase class I)